MAIKEVFMKLLLFNLLLSLTLIGCSQDSSDGSKKSSISPEDSSAIQFDVDGMGITSPSGSIDPMTINNFPFSSNPIDLQVRAKNMAAGSILLGVKEMGSDNLEISGACLEGLISNPITSVESICDFQIEEKNAKDGSNQYYLSLLYKDGADQKYYRRFYSITITGDTSASDSANLQISSSDLQFGSIESQPIVRSLVFSNSNKKQNAPLVLSNLNTLSRFKIVYNSCPSELSPNSRCFMRFVIDPDSSFSNSGGGIISESFLVNGSIQSLTATFPAIDIIPPEQAIELELSDNLIDLGGSLSSEELRTISVKNTTEYDLPSIVTRLNPDISVLYNSCEGKSLAVGKKCIIRFLLNPERYTDSLSFLEVESLPYASSVASIYAGDGSDVNAGGDFTLDEILGARLEGEKVYVSGSNSIVIKGSCDANKDLSLLTPVGTDSVTCDGTGAYSHSIDVESIEASQGEGFWSFTLSYIQGKSLTKTVETDYDDSDPAKMPTAVFDVTRFDQSVFE